MAAWDWDVTSDLKDLTKRHAQLEKLVKNAPDAAKNKAKRQNLDRQINEKKLEVLTFFFGCVPDFCFFSVRTETI
jgi:hypothetical protein